MSEELKYIKESMESEGVLTFYVKSSRYFISSNDNNSWTLYFDDNGNFKELRTFKDADAVFDSDILDNKTLEELLILDKNNYEFV